MKSTQWFICVIALVASAAAIGDGSEAAPASCLPAELSGWHQPDQDATPTEQPTVLNLYFDGSGSMAGYNRKMANAADRPIPDLLTLLPGEAAARGDQVKYWRFGSHLTPVSAADSAGLATEAAYECRRAGSPKVCDNQESHLDAVFDAISASNRQSLSVVVTDFWLDNSELVSSGPVALGLKLTQLFEQGRSIKIIGLIAPYRGLVYDLPGGGSYSGADTRPLFVLLIGPGTAIQEYRDALLQGGSSAFAESKVHEALFSVSPFIRQATLGHRLRIDNGDEALRQDVVLTAAPAAPLQQFALSRSGMMQQAVTRQYASFHGDLPLTSLLSPGAIWTGRSTAVTSIWMLRDADALESGNCSPSPWVAFSNATGGWSSQDKSGADWAMDLSANSTLGTLPSGQIYLVLSSLTRNSLSLPNPADEWLRRWSFSLADQPGLIARHPKFFPVLNLTATTTMLEAALQRAATTKPLRIGAFAFVVRLDD